MNVTVFSTETCPWCAKVKEFLKEHKVKFKELDVGKDQEAGQEMIKKSGQSGVPVIEIDKEIIIGFDKDRLSELLKL